MYSDKENINILTSLLVAHGVRHAVVCPGSRNAPIVHNLCECPDIQCQSVTDERSAAFIALGMAQALDEPVAVCVTSGSALLNTLPGVCEAFYQHRPLVIISGDRPAAMIGQLQGQTLPQPDALGRFVKKAVSLPEPHDDTERWYCNRLVNDALIAMQWHGCGPVHINVPITEPLFEFNVKQLPTERSVVAVPCARHQPQYPQDGGGHKAPSLHWMKGIEAERPMLVIGQLPYSVACECRQQMDMLRKNIVVLQEQLSDDSGYQCHFDETLQLIGDNADYQPDVVIYIGDTLVSKRIKRFLQSFTPKRTVVVNDSGELTDVTMHATDLVESSARDFIALLSSAIEGGCWRSQSTAVTKFYKRWKDILDECKKHCSNFQPAYSQMLAVKLFHERVNAQECRLQYANSTAVRLGLLYSTHYLYVNRGVNGIEGCLSTAVGFASQTSEPVYCVIGDLSFFYDQNALWNNLPKDNLRILLLNNGCGGIFHQLPGLSASEYRDGYVAAAHHTSAKGICEETNVSYKAVTKKDELANGIDWLTEASQSQPRLLEVFTDPETDSEEQKRLMKGILIK